MKKVVLLFLVLPVLAANVLAEEELKLSFMTVSAVGAGGGGGGGFGEPLPSITVESVFSEGEWIPEKYTCDGQDISPPIELGGISANAKTIAIIMDDPDAPMGVFTHWLIWNIPASETVSIPEGIPKTELNEPFNASQGKNDFGKIGYNGPCPPAGEHRYFFKIYVLDTKINLEAGKTKTELLKAMEGHVIQYGELYGVYGRDAHTTPTPVITPIEPKMSVHPKEFETDVYQGSKAKFGIVIEETLGVAPLKNVKLETTPAPIRFVPSSWVSFSRNHFDISPRGQVTVYCTIDVPKDAETGEYYLGIIVEAENAETQIINGKLNVLKDIIRPEITVYSPNDGEVVHEPYVTIKGVAKDNIGIKSLKINKEVWIRPLAIGIEREAYVELPFEQEMQLEKGWNTFTIEAEDLAGNKASKTIYVKYEPIIVTLTPIPTATPVECLSDEDCMWCGQECVRRQSNLICPAILPPPNCECICSGGECAELCEITIPPEKIITPTLTPEVIPVPILTPVPEEKEAPEAVFEIENLSISIQPKYAEARPGDVINYTVTIDCPPITNQIPIPIPENILPLTYKLRLEVTADSLKASDETTLKIVPKIPGFGVTVAIAAVAVALALRRRLA